MNFNRINIENRLLISSAMGNENLACCNLLFFLRIISCRVVWQQLIPLPMQLNMHAISNMFVNA